MESITNAEFNKQTKIRFLEKSFIKTNFLITEFSFFIRRNLKLH